MRTPRDIDRYASRADAAQGLREVAEMVERVNDGALVKVDVQLRFHHVTQDVSSGRTILTPRELFREPRHFTLVLGRIAHLAIGNRVETLCGRLVGDHPTRLGLTAEEAVQLCDCKTCRKVVRP